MESRNSISKKKKLEKKLARKNSYSRWENSYNKLFDDCLTTVQLQQELCAITSCYFPSKLLYSLNTFKWHKSNIKNLWMKSLEIVIIFLSAFYLIIWLMTSPKNFEKISILKIWQLDLSWGLKSYFGILPLIWCLFRHGKNRFSKILPSNSSH